MAKKTQSRRAQAGLPKKTTRDTETYPDPSTGKDCGPVCVLSFTGNFEVSAVCYGHNGNGPVRTYSPGKVDERLLPLEPVFCDDQVELSKAAVHGSEKKYVVPVSVAKEVLGKMYTYAEPDEHPGFGV